MSPRARGGTARIIVDYAFDSHSLDLSLRTLRRIQAGAVLTLRGQGFHVEGVREQDRWAFNHGGSGNLAVFTDTGRDIFNGQMDGGEVWLGEAEAQPRPEVPYIAVTAGPRRHNMGSGR